VTGRRHGGQWQPRQRPESAPWPYVVIDSGRLLLVDPARIPPGLVRELVEDRLAVLVQGDADGPAFVSVESGGAVVLWPPWSSLDLVAPDEPFELADDD
jgi:hypothetical protein